MRRLTLIAFGIAFIFLTSCKNQGDNKSQKTQEGVNGKKEKVENIILMIGDGMGVSQLYAGMTVSKEPLIFEQFRHIGLQKTYSASDYITDSGASGTALATGKKTNNKSIGVGPDGAKLTSILELAEANDYASGLVSTSSILHATPASFIAHNPLRYNYEELALDFLKTDIDVFIGGGKKHFEKREDGKNLLDSLKSRNYNIKTSIEEIQTQTQGKLAGFTAEKHNPKYDEGRGEMLSLSTKTALNILDNNDKGFFLMVEASQIDWGGHDKDSEYIISELLDFNNAIKEAMNFAKNNPNTLLIVTSDHETGGMALVGGSIENHEVEAAFPTDKHTGVMVPVFAYGPGAENFQGIYENTAIFDKMKALFGF
jgi:alkaline phosphatase